MLFLTMSCVSASSWAPSPQQAGLALSKHRSRHQAPQCHWVCQCQGQKPVASFASHNLAMHKAPTMCTPGCQEGEGASSMHLAKARLKPSSKPRSRVVGTKRAAVWEGVWKEHPSQRLLGGGRALKAFWEETGFPKASGMGTSLKGFWEEQSSPRLLGGGGDLTGLQGRARFRVGLKG